MTDTSPDTEATATRMVPDHFFHQMLHELRTLELERVDIDGGRALSIGASGSWYFDWFERSVGRVDEHIGVEAFEEMPDDLPPYVRWNTSTADKFEGVDDESVDLVFAGQTTEHLWAGELTDFLLESHRVLRPGARLVLDSPNRLVTEFLHWSHGGHTVELSADEIISLLELAGFEVEKKTGVLVTRLHGAVLQLEDGLDRGDIVARRMQSGPELLDDSFIWWIVARRAGAAPEREALLLATERLFWTHWCTRVGRGMWPGPYAGSVEIAAGTDGPVASTLPFPIAGGEWVLGVDVDVEHDAVGDSLEVRVLDIAGNVMHAMRSDNAMRTEGRFTWGFTQPELEFACTVQLFAHNPATSFHVTMPFDLRAHSGKGVRAVG